MSEQFSFVKVAAVAHFWRYAVGPYSQHSPAVPFYTLREARAWFESVQRELPWSGVVLYKRKGWRGIYEIAVYSPKEKP